MSVRLRPAHAGVVLGALLSVSGASVRAELFAERITAENVTHRRVGGMHAIGGVGDWAFGNGTICAVLSDLSHEATLSPRGGLLVDVGHCGRADDEWAELGTLFNLSQKAVPPVDSIRAEADANGATLHTRGELDGLVLETQYRVDAEHPGEIAITSQVSRRAPGARLFLVGDVAVHGRRSLAPFTLSTRESEDSPGFVHPEVDSNSFVSLLRAIASADLHVFVGSASNAPGIAYGLWLRAARIESRDGSRRGVPPLAISGEDFSALGVLAAPSLAGDEAAGAGWFDLVRVPLMDLEPGERLVIERRLLVGDRADVASVTDRVFAAGASVGLRGRVDDREARIVVFSDDGAPITEVRPGREGEFSLRVPPRALRLEARAPGGRSVVREIPAAREGADLDAGTIALGTPARVTLPRGHPMRLTFVREGDGDPARFADDLLGHRIGDEAVGAGVSTPHLPLAGIESDPHEIVIAPGRWRVLATRGPEFELSEARLEARAGETQALVIDPPARAFETPGWISADLHVHSGMSDDSPLSPAQRLVSFAAEGAEVLVASEHDVVFDPAPLRHALGLDGRLLTIPGVEATSTVRSREAPHTFGHANVFPLVPDPSAYRGGAPDTEARRLRDLIADARALETHPLVQLNHPRTGSGRRNDQNLFTHLSVGETGFDPTRPLDDPVNRALVETGSRGRRDLDFDAIELMNGRRLRTWFALRGDWFSLLLQGEVRTATANSDSHDPGELVALPRNYVRMDDEFVRFDRDAFVAALRAQHAFGTTGPFVVAAIDGAGVGDTARGSTATLDVAVRAASWVPVSRMRVLVNGEIADERPCRAGTPERIVLSFARDSFVTVEIEGDADERFTLLTDGSRPFAFTNPIFVDADGDGRWTAPGLLDPLPSTLR